MCTAALAVLDVIEKEGLLENCRSQGERLLSGLNEVLRSAGIDEPARGLGLLIGAPVGTGRAHAVVAGLLERGFLATEAGPDVVRATPPLTVDAGSVDAFLEALADALTSVTQAETRVAQ